MDKNKRTTITPDEAQAVLDCGRGSDVIGFDLASKIRSVERKTGKALVTICTPMGHYGVHDKTPYFGCIATKLGIIVARSILDAVKEVSRG